MHIESSGVTVDTVPVSNVQSFLGWEQLHLQHTSAVANDSPFMDGIVDAQPIYVNPFDIGYSFDQEYYGAESFNADVNGGYSGNYAGQGASSLMWLIHLMKFPPQNSISYSSPHRSGLFHRPRNWCQWTTTSYSCNPCGTASTRINSDFPYMVSLIDTPFVSVPSSETGSNRFGSLARNLLMMQSMVVLEKLHLPRS